MSTWADRIKERMKALDMTQEELAAKLAITRGAVTHYLTGRRVPPLRKFDELAKALKTDAAWLQYGSATRPDSETAAQTAAMRHSLPILSWKQVAKNRGLSSIKESEINDYLPHFYTDQSDWYALRVAGDSMTLPQSPKCFHEGDIIIVDPNQKAKHGSFVIALLPSTKEPTFKEYVIDSGIQYLKPLNPQYPLTKIDDKTRIIAVVVGRYNAL